MNLKSVSQFILIAILIISSAQSFSQWNTNDAINTAVCLQPNNQQDVRIVSDSHNGAIIVWVDYRNDASQNIADVYVQRIDQFGYTRWTANGVAICTNAADQSTPVLVADGSGGAIITWTDERNGDRDIFAQRIDSTGNILWAINGVPVVSKPNAQQDPHLVADNSGGAIIVWQDSSNGFWDIYAQRVNDNGTTLWSANGVPVCNAILSQINARIAINDAGGAFITWQDYRNTNNYDIYAQSIDLLGMVQWTPNGIVISNSADTQNNPKIESDGAGGAIIAWQDKRNGNDYNIYAQRVAASGGVQWANNGIVICSAPDNQSALDITTDAINGAIISWKDNRNLNFDIFAQRVNASGIVQWTNNGVAIATGIAPQLNPNNVGDGSGGSIIVWQDSTNGSWDIRAQHIDSSGTVLWLNGGNWVGTAANSQTSPKNVEDGNGGCIFTWQDKRVNNNFDIYAHHLYSNGNAVGIKEQIAPNRSKCFPNPFSTIITISVPGVSLLNTEIRIKDALGNTLITDVNQNGSDFVVNRNKLNSGIYLFEIVSLEKNIILTNGKFIIAD